MPDGNGWNEYSRLVFSEIKRLDLSVQHLTDEINSLKTDVAIMKVKYGLIGGAIGMIPGIVAIVLRFL